MSVRVHVRLDESQLRQLRRLAALEGRSAADLIRESVADLLDRPGVPDPRTLRLRALEAAGAFPSGRGDLSERHDAYLAESFGG